MSRLVGISIIFVCCLVVISVMYQVLSVSKSMFVDTHPQSIVANMNENADRRLQLVSSLFLFDPRLRKYQDSRLYDFHVAGNATQYWKTNLKTHIMTIADKTLESLLNYKDSIILFDQPNLVGNIIFLPLEGEYPQNVTDEIMLRKYIKWNPPSNMISCVVPPGFNLEFSFENDNIGVIGDGITRSFVIPTPIKTIRILKK